MQRIKFYTGLIAAAVIFLAHGQFSAATSTNSPAPACRQMRNSIPGAPQLPEPNRADALAAMSLAGSGNRSPIDHAPVIRRRFALAFQLMQKIDAEGTTALAALPPDTPRIDLIIDRHLIYLIWARSMLAIFYEQGRAPPLDYATAGAFYRKSIETQFIDERGCAHGWPPAASVLIHLAGYYAYGVGVPHDPAKARELLRQAGAEGKFVLTLLDRNAMPSDIGAYLDIIANPNRLEDVAYAAEHPRSASDPPNLMTWIAFPDVAMQATVRGPIETAATWAGLIAAGIVIAFAGLWLLHWRRARLEQRSSVYRTAFAAYDVVQRIMGRIGLFASGAIACGTGVLIFVQASFFGFTGPIRLLILFSGVTALLGGIAKLIEAARFSHTPKDTQVHGAARPAAEKEAQAAARGDPGASPLRDRTFKD